MPFCQNHIYPLRDPRRYDDDLGQGYGYALLADYGPPPSDCWLHDAWIVTADGDVHPGLSASPVPVRFMDVVQDRGRLFVVSR